MNDATVFVESKPKPLAEVQDTLGLQSYLKGITLEALLQELRAQGVTQKAFAASIGMNSQHLSAIKSSELRNRYFNELGATKLACLWVLEHLGKSKTE